MKSSIIMAVSFAALLPGCVPERGVDGLDLQRAFYACLGHDIDSDTISNRIACTQAAYGGRK